MSRYIVLLYNNFIGIDIGKFNFVVNIHGQKNTTEYENTSTGIADFLKDHKKILSHSLCILETTGGYEMRLLLTLCEKSYSAHRANTRKVKNFIRSFGEKAKTDSLDAKALSQYGFERWHQLDRYTSPSKNSFALYELTQRRNDLKQALVAEKNRLEAPRTNIVKESCQIMIDVISEQIEIITNQINQLIDEDPILKVKKEELKTVPGIGDITANNLLVLLPELGNVNGKQIASLAGVAPKCNQSGKRDGYRFTGHGRNLVKPVLFMAARKSKSALKDFYEKLTTGEKNKPKMKALVALMRKIIVIANARLRDLKKKLELQGQAA